MPAAKRVRITCTVDAPVKKRLEQQAEKRGYSISALMEKGVLEYLVVLEQLPSLDEQILRYVNPRNE